MNLPEKEDPQDDNENLNATGQFTEEQTRFVEEMSRELRQEAQKAKRVEELRRLNNAYNAENKPEDEES